MITGEERLRENLADLYGNVTSFAGRPTQTQLDRADAIARELADVAKAFDAWAGKDLVALNAALAGKHAAPIAMLTRAQWEQ